MKCLVHFRSFTFIYFVVLAVVLSACGGGGAESNIIVTEKITVLKQIDDGSTSPRPPSPKAALDQLSKTGVTFSGARCAFIRSWRQARDATPFGPEDAIFVDIFKKDLVLAEIAGFRSYDESKDFGGWIFGPVPLMRIPWLDRPRDCDAPFDNVDRVSSSPGGRVGVVNWSADSPSEPEKTFKLRSLGFLAWPEIKTAIRSRQEWVAFWNKNLGVRSNCQSLDCLAPKTLMMPEFDFDKHTLVVVTGLPSDRETWLDPLYERNGVIVVRTASVARSLPPVPGRITELNSTFFQVAKTSLPFEFEKVCFPVNGPSNFAPCP